VSKAYVETTVLTDALLKPGARADAAKSAIHRYQESLLPVYSIKEFKAGPLRHYVWFHGKLVTTKSWEQTLTQLRKTAMSPFRARWVSTAVEALEAAAHKNRAVTLEQLVGKYGALAKEDAVLCDRYRLSLRLIIMKAWRKRRELTTAVIDELSCYSEGDIIEERGLIELGETACQPKDECHLAAKLKGNPQILKIMKAAVDAQPSKNENVKRSQVLRDLVRLPNQKLTPQQCRHLGDAVFAFFCPADATILTTNLTDLRPLAEALGKKVEAP
jgi:hypothetical protein